MVRDEMTRITRRLRESDIGPITVTLVESICFALADMLSALRREIKEQRERGNQPSQGGGDPNRQQALLDRLAELRLIANLQRHIQRRTLLTADLIKQGLSEADAKQSLEQLAERQARVYEITRELSARKLP